MAKYTIVITKSVQKQLSKLPGQVAEILEERMLALEDNPRPPDSKKLKGREGYRLREGDYRIIYEIQDTILTVIVLVAGHRRDIYK